MIRTGHRLNRVPYMRGLGARWPRDSIFALLLDDRLVADLLVLDRRHPALCLVLPVARYDRVQSQLQDYGDWLWTHGFSRFDPPTEIRDPARDILKRFVVADARGRPLHGIDADLFDCRLDRPTCPFALLDLRSSRALFPARLAPPCRPELGAMAASNRGSAA